MSRSRRARRRAAACATMAVAVLAVLGFAGWLFGGSYLRQRQAALALGREAAVEGPPCPSLTREQFEARGYRTPKATFYEGVTFGRAFGHMECRALRYGRGWGAEVYPVCQFTSPKALWVRTDKSEWWFAPGPGQPATVAAPHGRARCVMASNFTLQRLMGR